MELELAYRPTGKQLAFHASTADEVLYGGAAGGVCREFHAASG